MLYKRRAGIDPQAAAQPAKKLKVHPPRIELGTFCV